MPEIYLSPSTQEYNDYVTGGSEEYWMNRLVEAMVPLLTACGIRYARNTPDMTAASSIQASNRGDYALHLALHSNASGPDQAGQNRGILAFYYPGSFEGKRAAEFLVDALRSIYPLPDLVRTEPTTTLGEIRRVKAPAVLLELGFHDNPEDAQWITSHIRDMAEAIVLALTEYFGLPFFFSSEPRPGRVTLTSGFLRVRDAPSLSAPVIARLYDGAMVRVLNEYNGWYLVSFGDAVGYASGTYITLL